MMRKSAISLGLVILSAPIISGQDFPKQRSFSLGTSLAALSKQVGQDSQQANLTHQSPAVIQVLTYWPLDTPSSSVRVEPVSQISFSSSSGGLCRAMVTYDQNAIEGMTEEGMVQAISTRQGNGRPRSRAAEKPENFSPVVSACSHKGLSARAFGMD
jgi:hypothetical protein